MTCRYLGAKRQSCCQIHIWFTSPHPVEDGHLLHPDGGWGTLYRLLRGFHSKKATTRRSISYEPIMHILVPMSLKPASKVPAPTLKTASKNKQGTGLQCFKVLGVRSHLCFLPKATSSFDGGHRHGDTQLRSGK